MEVISDVFIETQVLTSKGAPQGVMLKDELASYQLVGKVMAYQGYDA